MTILAQRGELKNPVSNEFTTLYHDDCLELYGNSPVTVVVVPVLTPAGVVPGFALPGGTAPHIEGIHWHYPSSEAEYSLFITFQLAEKICEVRCDTLWYSVVQDATQQLCVRTGRATYHFDVTISEDVEGVITVDPKIIVTPINALSGCDDSKA